MKNTKIILESFENPLETFSSESDSKFEKQRFEDVIEAALQYGDSVTINFQGDNIEDEKQECRNYIGELEQRLEKKEKYIENRFTQLGGLLGITGAITATYSPIRQTSEKIVDGTNSLISVSPNIVDISSTLFYSSAAGAAGFLGGYFVSGLCYELTLKKQYFDKKKQKLNGLKKKFE